MMMRISLLIVLFIVFVGGAFPKQSTINGNIHDVAGMNNCYLVVNRPEARPRIVKELKKQYPQVKVVDSTSEAQFVIEYKVLRIESDNDPTAPITYSEMIVYTMKDNQRVVAWSDKENDEGPSRKNEINLVRNFVKALVKAKVIPPRD